MERANRLQFRHQTTEHLSHNQERKNDGALDDVSVQKIPRRRSGIEVLDKAKGCLAHKTVKVNFIFFDYFRRNSRHYYVHTRIRKVYQVHVLNNDSFSSLYLKRKRVVTRRKSSSNQSGSRCIITCEGKWNSIRVMQNSYELSQFRLINKIMYRQNLKNLPQVFHTSLKVIKSLSEHI